MIKTHAGISESIVSLFNANGIYENIQVGEYSSGLNVDDEMDMEDQDASGNRFGVEDQKGVDG